MVRKKKSKRISSITGLRGVALLGVSAFHLIPNKVPGGFLGVVIFFVLSGFFMERKLGTAWEKDETLTLSDTILTRIRRIYPPLIVMVAAVMIWSGLVQPEVYRGAFDSFRSVLTGTNNLYQLSLDLSYFDRHGTYRPFTHLWALSLEIQFYIFFPLLYKGMFHLFGKERRPKILTFFIGSLISAAVMIFLYHPGEDPTRVYYGTDTRLFSFFLGAMFSLMERNSVLRRRPFRLYVLEAVLHLVVILPFFFVEGGDGFLYPYGMFFYSLIVGFLCLLHVKILGWGGAILKLPPFKYLGSRSYSLYLYQYPIQILFMDYFAHSKLGGGTKLFLQIVLLLIIGELSYRFTETRKKRGSYRGPVTVGLLVLTLIFPVMVQPPDEITAQEALQAKLEEKEKDKTKEDEEETEDEEELIPENEWEETVAKRNETYPFARLGKEDLEKLKEISVTAIGDSVLVMAEDDLRQYIPNIYIDGKINRQMFHAIDILKDLKASGQTGDVLFLSLGTNGEFNYEDLEEINRIWEYQPLVVINTVMPDPWEDSVNEKLKKFADENDNVVLVDWYEHLKTKKDLFYNDQTHPVPEGAALFAQMAAKGVVEAVEK